MTTASLKRNSDALADESIDPRNQVLDIPNNSGARIIFIKQELLRVIGVLCAQSKKINRLPDAAAEPMRTLLPRLEIFLQWLETSVEMTPALKASSKIDAGLKNMFDEPRYYFEERTRERARQLYERWEAQNWGKGEVAEDSTDDDEANDVNGDGSASSSKRKKSSSDATARRDSGADIAISTIRAPRVSHPIFGEHGIMHGVVLKITDGRKSYILDSRYPKREAKVYGHNNLEVGQWWPLQILALFHGAHGSRMGGIAGNSETGAYSVVTAGGAYEELDQDQGNTLYYSGSGSHANTDPKQPMPSTAGTNALKASMRMHKPIRVLRAAGVGGSKSRSSWRPTVGIRYDGLYRVAAMQLKINTNGGLYEQFKLERLGNQRALEENKSRPTPAEVRDFYKRDEGY
jgi:hypothetical protein